MKWLVQLLDRLPQDIASGFAEKGLQLTWNWREMWQEAHARAFTVAKVMDVELLTDMRDVVDAALRDGLSYGEFEKQLLPSLKKHGWLPHDSEGWPTNESPTVRGPKGQPEKVGPWRLRTIYDTNLVQETQVGRFRQMTDPDVLAERPWWEYVTTLDDRTTPACREKHREIHPADDPWWQVNYPSNHWGCRAHVRTLSDSEIDRRGLRGRVRSGGTNVWEDVGKAGEGWGFNPGLTSYTPDATRYPAEFRGLL